MTGTLRAASAAILLSAGLLAPQALHAQSFPSRPVTIIVPTTPGGGTDIISRLIGEQLSKPFVIENRPGAGLVVGTVAGAKATPDGYTLLAGLNASLAMNVSLFANLPYDPIRDFTPVAMLANYPLLVVVHNDLPANSIKELIALAKSKPGQINYASAGNGTGQHLATELFKMMTETNLEHVPYRGAQPAYIDVISGRVPVFFDNMSGAMNLVKNGKVRALAISTKTRSALMPEVPTLHEAGVPGFEYHSWFGLWAPAGTPRPIVDRLHAEVRKALADPAVREKIAATAGDPSNMPLAEIEPFLKTEIDKWADVIKRAGVKVN
jgi:tripartite-type tricarboxylate transporter receptor subunit TctC